MSFFTCEIQDDLEELGPHHIPVEKLTLPLWIQAESFLSDKLQWPAIYEGFDRFCEEKGFVQGMSGTCQAFAQRTLPNGMTQYAFIESKTNHFIVQIWSAAEDGNSAPDARDSDFILDISAFTGASNICSTLIYVSREHEQRDPEFYFGTRRVFISSILGGAAQLWATYAKNASGRELYVVKPFSPEGVIKLEREAIRAADAIIHLETLYHLITAPKMRFKSVAEEVRDLENDLDASIVEIAENLGTRDLDTIRAWVKQMSMDFARLTQYKQILEVHSADMRIYKEDVERLLTWWIETSVDGDPSLSLVVKSNIASFSRDYTWLYSRIVDLTARVDNMVGIVRTRLEILNQRQLLSTEGDIKAALTGQLETHHKLQGLYSIFCAFYFTEISLVICEALHLKGWLHVSPAMATAPLIPLFLVLGLVLSGTMRRWTEKSKK